MKLAPEDSPLGHTVATPQSYAPDLLRGIPRARGRADLRLAAELPFAGVDIWNAYELSWLDECGKPLTAVGEIIFPVSSPNIIESKSLKLYLNSLNQTRFATLEDVHRTVQRDLSVTADAHVDVSIAPVSALGAAALGTFPGTCLDDLAVTVTDYDVNPELLEDSARRGEPVAEAVHTHVFKSNCPVTGQPDWASVLIQYRGPAIDHGALLKYLISYRKCTAFHEHCVERIFVDIETRCRPQALTVYARYLRRGGLDINPFRSNFETAPNNLRLARQ